MARTLLDRILPRGTELLRRLALAEVLGPPPSSVRRQEELQGDVRGPRSSGPPRPEDPRRDGREEG